MLIAVVLLQTGLWPVTQQQHVAVVVVVTTTSLEILMIGKLVRLEQGVTEAVFRLVNNYGPSQLILHDTLIQSAVDERVQV